MSWKIDEIEVDVGPREIRTFVRRERQVIPIMGESEPLIIDLGVREHAMEWIDCWLTTKKAASLQDKAKTKEKVIVSTPDARFNGEWNMDTVEISDRGGTVNYSVCRMRFMRGAEILRGEVAE